MTEVIMLEYYKAEHICSWWGLFLESGKVLSSWFRDVSGKSTLWNGKKHLLTYLKSETAIWHLLVSIRGCPGVQIYNNKLKYVW